MKINAKSPSPPRPWPIDAPIQPAPDRGKARAGVLCALAALMMSLNVYALQQERGVGVRVKDGQGREQYVKLYEGSYAGP